jgi:N-acyl homoserine lactone hydrolase
MSDKVARVVVVREGYIVREGTEIKDASSSVSLVESGGQRLIVDTGSPRGCTALRSSLDDLEVPIDSVKYLVNTHLHIDHIGCNRLFRNAVTYAHALETPPIGTVKVTQSLAVLPGVKILHTPGHSHGSITVLVEGTKRYAICGDAIPTRENYEKHVPPFINVEPKLALQSMDAIASYAEIIVPGHGAPFEVVRKK